MPALMAKPNTATPTTSLRSCIREVLSIVDGRRVTSSGSAPVSEGIEKSPMPVGKGFLVKAPNPTPFGIAPFPMEDPTVWIERGSNGDAGLGPPSTAAPPTVSALGRSRSARRPRRSGGDHWDTSRAHEASGRCRLRTEARSFYAREQVHLHGDEVVALRRAGARRDRRRTP